MYSLDDQIEIAPGQFKRVAECTLEDTHGAYAIAAELCELTERIGSILKAERQRGLTARIIPRELNDRFRRGTHARLAGRPPASSRPRPARETRMPAGPPPARCARSCLTPLDPPTRSH